MPSPFPGMDPWLERPGVFPCLHNGLIYQLQAALNAGLPPGYVATTVNRVWLEAENRREPDVSLYGPNVAPPGSATATAFAAAGLVAVTANTASDPLEEPLIEVFSDEGDRLVTAIEIVSPSNKRRGDGRVSYRSKQAQYRDRGINTVEIDLLRGGTHVTAVAAPALTAVLPGWDYHLCVTLPGEPPQQYARPFRIADPLPPVAVPLDRGVEPVIVSLGAAFDRCYHDANFAVLAKYNRREPDPPLTPEQKAWADDLLRMRGA